MTVILGALDSEIDVIFNRMKSDENKDWLDFPIRVGSIEGEPVVVSRSGIGKTLSAMLTQHLIDEHHPDRIIFTGVAGALVPQLAIGDMVIGSETIQHDMDVTQLGFAPGQIPYTPHRVFAADPRLRSLAEAVKPLRGIAHTGRILTGDQLIGTEEVRDRLARQFEGLAVEMEGASVGLVATVNRIPFLLLRTISDSADGSVTSFEQVIAVAAENSWHYLREMLTHVKETTGEDSPRL